MNDDAQRAGPSEELRAKIAAYGAWYHEFDFGGGCVSRPKHPHRAIWAENERFLDAVDFRGKSVLDIGCWDGYWSFYAERRGAAEVLATDDNSQYWTQVTPDGAIGTKASAESGRDSGWRMRRCGRASVIEGTSVSMSSRSLGGGSTWCCVWVWCIT